jgi:hypothetical protein
MGGGDVCIDASHLTAFGPEPLALDGQAGIDF